MNETPDIFLVTVGDYTFNLLDISFINGNTVHLCSGKTVLLDEDTRRRLRFLLDGLPGTRSADALYESREIVEDIRIYSLAAQRDALKGWRDTLENAEKNPVPGPELIPGIQ